MSPRKCRFVVLLSMILIMGACTGGGSPGPTAPGEPSPAQVELVSFDLVNGARLENGVSPQLALRVPISEVARAHSEAMRDEGFFGHEDGLGREVGDRLAAAGIPYQVVAENLAMVTNAANPAAWAHDQLMQSAEHRPNILDPSMQLIGVGVAKQGHTYWITQIFVGS
jgi:uncharacterized protein YkwD